MILDPAIRWFPADEESREKRADQLMPPLVPTLRKDVKAWREDRYDLIVIQTPQGTSKRALWLSCLGVTGWKPMLRVRS